MSSTASAFSSSDQAVLERETEAHDASVTLEEIWNATNRKVCSNWIKQHSLKKICLQFPDDYLAHSVAISDSLKSLISSDAKIFIMADTSYGSCCVDEVAAAHVEADCIIHFGNACYSKVTRLPVLYILPYFPFNLEAFFENLSSIKANCSDKEVCIYLDIGYHHLLEHNKEDVEEAYLASKSREILQCKELFVEVYPQEEDARSDYEPSEDRLCLFIGGDNHRLSNLSLTTKASEWFVYDPNESKIKEVNPLLTKYIRKRYYYIEKCKDAKTLGLIVATLSTDGYLDVIARIQEMAKGHGIQTKIISVGRINPSKLANFLEIDCFVLIGCPFNNLYEEKEYYKPIVSIFEAEMALNPAWLMKYPDTYVTDFKDLLPEGKSFLPFESDKIEKQDVSLVSGKMRNVADEAVDVNGEGNEISNQEQSLVSQPKMELMTSNTGLEFEDRTWKGLDPALGQTEVAKMQKGLSGIPIKYTHD